MTIFIFTNIFSIAFPPFVYLCVEVGVGLFFTQNLTDAICGYETLFLPSPASPQYLGGYPRGGVCKTAKSIGRLVGKIPIML